VAGRAKMDSVRRERRRRAAIGARELGRRQQLVDTNQRREGGGKLVVVGTDQSGQIRQNAAHDRLFLPHRDQQLVVQFDREQRFDENGFPGDRPVLNDSLDSPHGAGTNGMTKRLLRTVT